MGRVLRRGTKPLVMGRLAASATTSRDGGWRPFWYVMPLCWTIVWGARSTLKSLCRAHRLSVVMGRCPWFVGAPARWTSRSGPSKVCKPVLCEEAAEGSASQRQSTLCRGSTRDACNGNARTHLVASSCTDRQRPTHAKTAPIQRNTKSVPRLRETYYCNTMVLEYTCTYSSTRVLEFLVLQYFRIASPAFCR